MDNKSGKCYGNWRMNDPACSTCFSACRIKCEAATKRRLTGEGVVILDSSEVEDVKVESVPETTPADYLIKILEGKFEKQIIWNEDNCVNIFLDGGTRIACVALNSDSGKIKVKSLKLPISTVFTLESIEQAEELLGKII